MGMVQRVSLVNAFDATGKYVPEGHIGTFDEDKITDKDKHLVDPGDLPATVAVQIAAIAPTGPNPVTPQQIPPDAVQGPGGNYVTPGKTLVGEVTRSADQRIGDAGLDQPGLENEVSEALAKIAAERGIAFSAVAGAVPTASSGADAVARSVTTENNNDDALVNGTVKSVTADLGTKSNEELAKMRAAENDREQPRKGVLSAIDEELDARKESANKA